MVVRWTALTGALVALLACASSALAAGGAGPLDMYAANVSAEQAAKLASDGYDLAAVRPSFAGTRADLVLSRAERDALAAQGIKLQLLKNKKGQTVRQQAALQAAAGFSVYRSYDEPGGIRDELYDLARERPNLVKLEVIGHTLQGREIIALKVTAGARGTPDGERPDVLYMGTIHAREWIATEVTRRLLHYLV